MTTSNHLFCIFSGRGGARQPTLPIASDGGVTT